MNDTGIGVVGVLLLAFLYFLPTIVAMSRGHRSYGGILVLNLFLGWTFIGWLIALVWACSATGAPAPPVNVYVSQQYQPPPQYYPPPPTYVPPALSCGRCGAELTGNRQFCSACGARVLHFLEGQK
ncbi:MAG TPA: superinfection immunity protein [Terracidiphilus sp.]|nr:superinfection immunity protein [Terracidiphilus sp.]